MECERLTTEGWALRSFAHPCASHEMADHRTVGLPLNFHHLDIQLYFPMRATLALNILHTAIEVIKTGVTFQPGSTSTDILHDLTVTFIEVTVDGQKMLRMILPDRAGRYQRDVIAEPYARQYRDTET